MKCMVLLAFTLSCTLAKAASEVPLPNPDDRAKMTRLQTLAEWYSQGRPLTFMQFKGFYSGRCFYVNNPSEAKNVMTGYVSLHEGNDNAGPGFPSTNYYKMSVIMSNSPTENFDDEAKFAANKSILMNLTLESIKKFSDIKESPTLSFSYDWEGNGNPDENHEFVTYNEYLVEKWTAMYPQNYGDMGYKKPGELLGMCYYFKKLE